MKKRRTYDDKRELINNNLTIYNNLNFPKEFISYYMQKYNKFN